MVNLTILAGGYTSFIATYIFNTDNNALTLAHQSPSGTNVSWISADSQNKTILYAVNEVANGAAESFVINSDGSVTSMSSTSSGGNGPAFTAPLTSGQVAIMNYNSGNGMIIPTSNPVDFESASLITFPAEVSHPHMALQNGEEVLVPDLGADKIWRLKQAATNTPGAWEITGFIEQPTGSGPRHIAVQEGYLYTLHELSSTLTSQLLPAAPNGTSSPISNFSIIPPNPPAGAEFAAAEILFPVADYSFPASYIYVSNRNTGVQDPRGDAITIFSVDFTGDLSIVDYVYTGLDQIRGMQLGGPNLEYLIAGGFADGGVAIFERTGNGGGLNLVARNTDLPTRTSFVFLD